LIDKCNQLILFLLLLSSVSCFQDQTAFDIADTDILKALENLREQQALIKENSQTNNKKQSSIPKKR